MEEIQTAIIVEMMGRPAEHLKDTMKELLKKLNSEHGVKILDKTTHKPKLLEQKDKEGKIIKAEEGKEMYTLFSEVTLELKSLLDLVRVVFAYMPSHIEVISPSELKMQNFDISLVLNEITKKMHGYDAIAKNAIMQNNMLVNRMQQMHTHIQELEAGNNKIKIAKTKKKSSKNKSSKKKIKK